MQIIQGSVRYIQRNESVKLHWNNVRCGKRFTLFNSTVVSRFYFDKVYYLVCFAFDDGDMPPKRQVFLSLLFSLKCLATSSLMP